MRLTLLSLAAVLAACATPRQAAEPLVVGPGPCDDYIVRGPDGQIERGCVGVPLVEATRTVGDGPVAVSGRVLLAGSFDPWPGATVAVVGRRHGVQTGVDGRFMLDSLGLDERLYVSGVGMWPDTLAVAALPGPRHEGQVP